MIISHKSHYMDVGKTGSSFVKAFLEQSCKSVLNRRHSINTSIIYGNFYWATVRNPFSYYASHYRYRSPILKHLQSTGYPCETLDDYIKAQHDVNVTFPSGRHPPQGPSYANFPRSLGHYTFRYLYQFDPNFLNKPRTEKEIEYWYNQYWFSADDNFQLISTVNLKENVLKLFETKSEYFGLKKNWKDINFVPSTEVAKVKKLDYRTLYKCDKTIELIYKADRLLIDRFGFEFDMPERWRE